MCVCLCVCVASVCRHVGVPECAVNWCVLVCLQCSVNRNVTACMPQQSCAVVMLFCLVDPEN